MDAQTSDSRSLVTLLHLRNIAGMDETPFSIVSEMQDQRNRKLAAITRIDDFIVSDHFISLITAQLSENPELKTVFDELFDSDGDEIYLKPVSNYIETGKPVNFHTLLEAAGRKKELAIGYRIVKEATMPEKTFGVYLNPYKSKERIFDKDDILIVLAKD